MEIKNYKKTTHISLKFKKKKSRKYNFISNIFPKIDLKFYSNVKTHNQTYEYV